MTDFKHNTRRGFVKNIALAGLAALGLPEAEAIGFDSNNLRRSENGDGWVFLFQGDSITDGNRGRNADPNHAMGHGYAFSIASRLGADFPGKKLIFYNRGISGNKVTELEARWQTDTLDLKPNLLSILVGVNDTASVVFSRPPIVSVAKFEEVYKLLLDRTKAQYPEVIIVLCNPFILPVGKVKDNWDIYQPEMEGRQHVVRKLADQYGAIFVDFQDVMNTACKRAPADYWMWDGVHPTVAGHELLAREWMRQVGKKVRFVR
jgi:lysophospholipase L1-like esterase